MRTPTPTLLAVLIPILSLASALPWERARAQQAEALPLSGERVIVHGASSETLSREEILALEVVLSRAKEGWIAPRDDLAREARAVGELYLGPRAEDALFGSALQTVARAIVAEHDARGLPPVEVDVRAGTSLLRDGSRNLVIELRPEFDSLPGAEPVPAAPDRGGANALLVTVRSIAIEGLESLPVSEEDLLATEVELSWDRGAVPEGWIAVPPGHAARRVALWTLGGYQRGGSPLYGSALQAIIDRLAKRLAERGIYGARVDLAPGAIRHLSSRSSDGLLTLRVEPGAR